MKGFLVGLGLGIGLGVLFAPMSGDETRGQLSERASNLASSARDTLEQGRDRMRKGVEAIRGTVDRESSQTRTGTGGGSSLGGSSS